MRAGSHKLSPAGIEPTFRIEPDGAWLVIRRPGLEPSYHEVQDRDVPKMIAELEAIGDSVERFNAFLSRVA
jgi:hypothetical protein